jgi:phage regulator Rha-like protein
MNELNIKEPQQVTMSSLEIVKMINDSREEGAAILQHCDFLKKVVKVLGKEADGNFSDSYKGKDGASAKCYNLPKREATLMVMSENYKVQAAVYDRMVELEKAVEAPKARIKANTAGAEVADLARTARAAISLAKMFGFKGNQALISADRATKQLTGTLPIALLGVQLVNEVKEVYLNPSELAKRTGLASSGAKMNQILKDAGLQTSYRDSKGKLGWTLTEKGKPFANAN